MGVVMSVAFTTLGYVCNVFVFVFCLFVCLGVVVVLFCFVLRGGVTN